MRPGLKNKKTIFITATLLLILCAGYVFYKPKLINAKLPFIDLAGSIGKAIGDAEKAGIAGENIDKPEPTATPTPKLTPTPLPTVVPADPYKDKVEIRVLDTIVKINGNIIAAERLENEISALAHDNRAVELVDEYAELKTYRRILKLLRSNAVSFTESPEE